MFVSRALNPIRWYRRFAASRLGRDVRSTTSAPAVLAIVSAARVSLLADSGASAVLVHYYVFDPRAHTRGNSVEREREHAHDHVVLIPCEKQPLAGESTMSLNSATLGADAEADN